jgi:hypothetical protein
MYSIFLGEYGNITLTVDADEISAKIVDSGDVIDKN